MNEAQPPLWTLYVLRCRDDSLYCGITTDLARRIDQHNRGTAARYTRARSPVTLRFHCGNLSHSAALRLEAAFKNLSRAHKLRVLQGTLAFPPIPAS
ncbi:MAG: hypothetical protein RLZZ244_815 [Verrucomicrobiota bacterium]|jgi:putative endonuclease